jgi:hypothetical protein
MQNRQERTVSSFHNVLFYLEGRPISPEPPLLTGMRKSLEASLTKIERHGTEQNSAKHAISGHVDVRVRKLRRNHMMPLVRIAKPLLSFAPGIEAALRVPHARSDAHSVATAAIKMADALTPHAKLLASAGCSKSYLRDFRKEARDLALVVKNAESARERRTKATNAIAAEIKKAMKTVTVIEGLVMFHLGGDKNSNIALWKNRRRVSKRIGRPRNRSRATSAHGSPATADRGPDPD